MTGSTVVNFFFRKARSGFFSIEGLFTAIIPCLPSDIKGESLWAPATGTSPRSLKRNLSWAKVNKGSINHITGDINYLTFALPAASTILTLHDIESLGHPNPLKNWLIQLFWLHMPARKAGTITVISQATKEKLLKATGVQANKVYVIPNCVSPRFQPFEKAFNAQYPRVLQLGTKSNKNLERLIVALEGIPCHLHIIGKLSTAQLDLLAKHKLDYSNAFDLDHNQIVEEYRQADIVAFVSLFEGFGLPILEAQATGRPVITSNCSSMPEVAGEAALLINPHHIPEIRDALLTLISDEQLRKGLIQKGFENVKKYSPTHIAALYAELYRKIALKG
jgi:glycosyltransferase involved in cell wall biosynthesis